MPGAVGKASRDTLLGAFCAESSPAGTLNLRLRLQIFVEDDIKSTTTTFYNESLKKCYVYIEILYPNIIDGSHCLL